MKDYSKIFKQGDRVKVSNGEPMPPKHHTRKLSSWKHQNYTGFVYEAKPGEIAVDTSGQGIIVQRYVDYYNPNLTFEPVKE